MSTATRTSGNDGSTSHSRLEVVASPRVARDLRPGALVPVIYTLGWEPPAPGSGAAFWCSGFWAARLVATGPYAFLAPDPAWLARLPPEFLGRRLRSGFLGDLRHPWHRPLFVGPAHHESRAFAGRVHRDADSLLTHAAAAFPGHSPQELRELATIVSEPVSFTQEFRCFVARGRVTAVTDTRTRHGGTETTWQAHSRGEGPDIKDARRFAQDVANAAGADQAPGYCLDVGRLDDGHWAVIDARPAWSADPCHADPEGAVSAILASQQESPDWSWRPDALTAARAQPLPRRKTHAA